MVSQFDIEKEKLVVERIKQGERAAFDELVQVYRDRGFAIAYNLVGNPEDAKDILQEAFIKVYLNIKGFNSESKFYTWFYRIVVNCSLDFIRKRKAMRKTFTEPLLDEEGNEKEIPDSRYVPSKIVLSAELAANLEDCIAKLSENQRISFVLKHQNGLSNQEIASVLKCSLSTVKVHLFRAVRALQDKLSSYVVK